MTSAMKSPVDADRQSKVRILRFDGVQRTAHWANALLFGILMVTALPLYFPSLSDVVGRRALVVTIHVWSGVVLPIPLVISLLGPWGAQMRRDIRRINVWTRDEVTWLRQLGRNAPQVVDKFNPGQKLNAIFIGAAIDPGDAGHRLHFEMVPILPGRLAHRRNLRPRRVGLRHLRRGHWPYSFCLDASGIVACNGPGMGQRSVGGASRSRVARGEQRKPRTPPAAVSVLPA